MRASDYYDLLFAVYWAMRHFVVRIVVTSDRSSNHELDEVHSNNINKK